tara:strand:+ start:1470 stop:1745 length:276 start_codon:yes stop_codon:yes gene_type:complete
MVLTTEKAVGVFSTALSKKKESKMKILILRDTMASGKKVSAGDVIELDNDTANTLISYGKAEISQGKVSEKKDRSVGLEKSEVKVKKRKGK